MSRLELINDLFCDAVSRIRSLALGAIHNCRWLGVDSDEHIWCGSVDAWPELFMSYMTLCGKVKTRPRGEMAARTADDVIVWSVAAHLQQHLYAITKYQKERYCGGSVCSNNIALLKYEWIFWGKIVIIVTAGRFTAHNKTSNTSYHKVCHPTIPMNKRIKSLSSEYRCPQTRSSILNIVCYDRDCWLSLPSPHHLFSLCLSLCHRNLCTAPTLKLPTPFCRI